MSSTARTWALPVGQEAKPDRQPLVRAAGPTLEFPVKATGSLRLPIEAIALKTQAPIAICANAVLASASLATSTRYDVEGLNGSVPLSCFFLSIAQSGERKTSVDSLAIAPFREIEKASAAGHEKLIAGWHADVGAWRCATEHAKKICKGNLPLIRTKLEEIGPEPKRPPSPMILVNDITPEGTILHFTDHAAAGIFASEGGTLLGGHGMSDDAKLRTGALLNGLWSGEPIRKIRAGTGATLLSNRRLAVHIMAQPLVAEILTADPVLNDVGLLARFLIAAPISTAGTRKYRQAPTIADDNLSEFGFRIRQIMSCRSSLQDGSVGPDLTVIPLQRDARKMLIAFHDFVESGLGPDGEFSNIRAFGSKMTEHALRLAGVMACYDDPDLVDISPKHVANGVELVKFYAEEMKRLSEGAAVSPDLKLAEKLLEWWGARRDPRCYLACIYQTGPNAIRDASTAKRIVAVLEDHGWIRRLDAGTVLDGMPRRDSWELIP